MAAAFAMGTFVSRTGRIGLMQCVASFCAGGLFAASASATTYSLIVSGLGGEPSYEQRFQEQARKMGAAAQRLNGDDSTSVVLVGSQANLSSLRRELRALATRVKSDDQVIVTLIGHGSFDGTQYRFNLPGPDITDAELATLLDSLKSREVLIVNATSASGAALEHWKRGDRIVITATKSGGERTATRFGQYWAEALSGTDADTNKNDVVTAAEAFDYASRKVAESFKSDALLATEHARLEGAGGDRFEVARLGTAARVTTDPQLNELYAQRVRIERELDSVKERKASLNTDVYYDELEGVLVKLATLQRDIDAQQPADLP